MVGIGRPYCYGLAIAGAAGVVEVLHSILAEMNITMNLSGWQTVSDLAATELSSRSTVPG
jgi:lactate 2-monooxygenase